MSISRRSFIKTTAGGSLAMPGLLRSAAAADEVLKVGVIHQGAIADTGWEYFQAQAWRSLEKTFPGKVKVTVLENIKENQDAERLFRQLSTQGHKLCFGTTFSHFASLKKLAPTLKRTHFECCAGIEASDNLGVFEARHYEGTYLTGIAAGRMTKSNILGWVGAFPVPQVIYSLNAFMLGARSVNPNATLRVVWVNAWVDPGKEKDGVAALVAQGADVISGSPNTPVQGLAAEEKGVWAIGSTGDFLGLCEEGAAHLVRARLERGAYRGRQGRDGEQVEAEHALARARTGRFRQDDHQQPGAAGERCRRDEGRRGGYRLRQAQAVCRADQGPERRPEGGGRRGAHRRQLKGINWLVEGVQGKLPSAS